MMKIVKTVLFGLLCLVVFFVLTFPYSRLTPKARKLLEQTLSSAFGIQANCSIEDFNLSLPFGVQWSKLVCVDDIAGQKVVDLGESTLSLLPGRQVLTAEIGKGTLTFKANAGFRSPPTRVAAEFSGVPVDKLMPLLMGAVNRANPQIPKYLKAEGKIDGSFDWPFKNLEKEKGKVDLQFGGLKFPTQSQLDLIGMKDLTFTKSSVKVNLAGGKMSFPEVAFLAQQMSGKLEGQLEMAEDIRKAVGSITLKWKVEKSDAVLSSLLGPMISNYCPSPDPEGYCTRKVSRVSDLTAF